jgi:hypothetical protein
MCRQHTAMIRQPITSMARIKPFCSRKGRWLTFVVRSFTDFERWLMVSKRQRKIYRYLNYEQEKPVE